ncbi:unnamed protein product [Lactuca virosa]|uniref:Uncharacterized protein n=1 Tax=Lactuca virosa TaxID=75947 RepID=A0AAU9MQT8_9ASTR|nr:unnamed protein product [Lactuca virosa]
MTFLCCCVVTGTEKKWLADDGDGASVYLESIDPVIPIDTEEVEENDSDFHSGSCLNRKSRRCKRVLEGH